MYKPPPPSLSVNRPELKALYLRIGEEAGLGKILKTFYYRMSQDLLIGFFFDGKNIDAIAEKQKQFLMRAMGAAPHYSGKSPAQAHLAMAPILSGHFDRRLRLLEAVLLESGVAAEDIRTWIDFENAFREAVESSKKDPANPGQLPTPASTPSETSTPTQAPAKRFRPNVVAVIVNDQNRVLACHRAGGSKHGHPWQLPQGGIEPGETAEQALYREVAEETGLTEVEILKRSLKSICYEWPPGFQAFKTDPEKSGYAGQEQSFFLVRPLELKDPQLPPATPDFDRYEWVTPQEMISRVIEFKKQSYRLAFAEFGL